MEAVGVEGGEGAEEPRRDWPVPWSWSGGWGGLGKEQGLAGSCRCRRGRQDLDLGLDPGLTLPWPPTLCL